MVHEHGREVIASLLVMWANAHNLRRKLMEAFLSNRAALPLGNFSDCCLFVSLPAAFFWTCVGHVSFSVVVCRVPRLPVLSAVCKHAQNPYTGVHVSFFIFRFVQQCMTLWCSDPVARGHRSLIRPVLPGASGEPPAAKGPKPFLAFLRFRRRAASAERWRKPEALVAGPGAMRMESCVGQCTSLPRLL